MISERHVQEAFSAPISAPLVTMARQYEDPTDFWYQIREEGKIYFSIRDVGTPKFCRLPITPTYQDYILLIATEAGVPIPAIPLSEFGVSLADLDRILTGFLLSVPLNANPRHIWQRVSKSTATYNNEQFISLVGRMTFEEKCALVYGVEVLSYLLCLVNPNRFYQFATR